MTMTPLNVGILGCGKISGIYLKNLTGPFADRVRVAAVADLVSDLAKQRAAEFNVPRVVTPDELLADPSVPLLLNLTPAPFHYDVSRQVLQAGKHLYSEKPLALSMPHARELVDLARAKNLLLAVAPDTLLGAGVQTCRHAIANGRIGTPMAAHAFVSLANHSERYATVFRGPLLDLGPYHVGALLTLLGPARSVSGIVQPKRQVTEGEALSPAAMTPDNPGNSGAVIEFVSGAIATLNASSEVHAYMPTLVVYGTAGKLTAPDPNSFGGTIKLETGHEMTTEELPHTGGPSENSRGVGVWDMAHAIANGRPPSLTADFALHTTELMLAIIESSKTARRIDLTTTFAQAPMPA